MTLSRKASADPRPVLDAFRQYLYDVRTKLEDLGAVLTRFDSYTERLPGRLLEVCVVLAAVVACAAGVVVPLVETDAPRFIYVGVPAVIYSVALAGLASWAVWRYWRVSRD